MPVRPIPSMQCSHTTAPSTTPKTGGFTPQYKELQALQDKYGEQGFMVLAFPCNRELEGVMGWGGCRAVLTCADCLADRPTDLCFPPGPHHTTSFHRRVVASTHRVRGTCCVCGLRLGTTTSCMPTSAHPFRGFPTSTLALSQGQEPGSASEVCTLMKDKFKVTFPIMVRACVRAYVHAVPVSNRSTANPPRRVFVPSLTRRTRWR